MFEKHTGKALTDMRYQHVDKKYVVFYACVF